VIRSALGRDLLFAVGGLILLAALPLVFPGKAFADFVVDGGAVGASGFAEGDRLQAAQLS